MCTHGQGRGRAIEDEVKNLLISSDVVSDRHIEKPPAFVLDKGWK
jgi:hypothetical protein